MKMEILCPCLRCLSLHGWLLKGSRGPIWSQMLDFVANFSPHFFYPNFTLRICNETPMDSHGIRSVGDAFKGCTFPRVKTFRTSSPNGLNEVLHFRFILAKFPNLKT